MDWLEASVTTNTPGADIVSEALMRYGAKGTQIIDRADVPDPAKPTGHWELVDPKLMEDMPEHVVVKAWFPEGTRLAALQEELATLPALSGLEMGELKLSFSQVKEEDWAEYWKNFTSPSAWARAWWCAPRGRAIPPSRATWSLTWTRAWPLAPARTRPRRCAPS